MNCSFEKMNAPSVNTEQFTVVQLVKISVELPRENASFSLEHLLHAVSF